MFEDERRARLRWRCRRGLRELDLLLGPFAERQLPVLAPDELDTLDRLLTAADQDLQSWFLGRERPSDDSLADLVERIRQQARSSE
ncbi:succinate dehydrogenase assembly factor 2 family protein [Guyparkeria sp. SCN-R1]|uniref:FAD assembly factor SdhE n=1 Tax=Guyparkeria sp. SCN-R1 TaxID=2341113 RepID=UPI000F6499D2|nr:succinate dehydrogenase assembly factor 2 [Guyparkeria sp. SCN-R1]RRQ24310.1 succinate dehydrogenase assembly factor 2 family protein [Guyparkeria sp. SCN-R1]